MNRSKEIIRMSENINYKSKRFIINEDINELLDDVPEEIIQGIIMMEGKLKELTTKLTSNINYEYLINIFKNSRDVVYSEVEKDFIRCDQAFSVFCAACYFIRCYKRDLQSVGKERSVFDSVDRYNFFYIKKFDEIKNMFLETINCSDIKRSTLGSPMCKIGGITW